MATAVSLWALAWLVVTAAVCAAAARLGPLRAAVWLTWIGLFLLTVEDGLLTAWYAVAAPSSAAGATWLADPEGVAGLVPEQVRAGVLNSATWAVVGALLAGWLARRALRDGQPWAWRALATAFAAVLTAHAITGWTIFSRGVPVPGPGGAVPGFGWEPIAVGLLAWALALAVSYRSVFTASGGSRAQRDLVPAGRLLQLAEEPR